MSIKKVIPYFCVLREGYYVIIWLIVRDRPFNLKRGYGFFYKKNILIPNVAEKNILILVEGKKKI
jgi:hypothetical protein